MAKNKNNRKANIRGNKQVGKKVRRPKPEAEEWTLNATTPNRNALRLIRQER